jgi:hypothetical protein
MRTGLNTRSTAPPTANTGDHANVTNESTIDQDTKGQASPERDPETQRTTPQNILAHDTQTTNGRPCHADANVVSTLRDKTHGSKGRQEAA